MDALPRLMDDGDGLRFEYLDQDEAVYLYEEIFTRRSYSKHGVTVPHHGQPVVVDLGANIGLFTLFALRENSEAQIVAVEPSPAAFAILERNVGHAGGNVTCVQLLARDRPGRHRLFYFSDSPGESTCNRRERQAQRLRLDAHRRAANSSKGFPPVHAEAGMGDHGVEGECAVEVEAQTLSQILWATLGQVSTIDLLKIDVEGDEALVLLGVASEHWPAIKQVVCEVHDIHGRLERVCGLLRRHGFRVHAEQQRGGCVGGYNMVVPPALQLWYVFARRRDVACAGMRRRSTGDTRPVR
jgi:FkbM family methyltransferase